MHKLIGLLLLLVGACAGPAQKQRIVTTSTSIEILEPIRFAAGSAELSATSGKTLDVVASTLAGNPSIKLIRVEAYSKTSTTLAGERAEVVRAALISRGIDGERLIAAGQTPDISDVENGVSFVIEKRVVSESPEDGSGSSCGAP